MNKPLCVILFLLVILVACSKTSSDEVVDGILEVPENRNDPNSRTLQLVYKVLKAKKRDSTNAPIVYLQGGPGVATLIMEEFWADHPLRNDRDIVLMDQRGTGASRANCINIGDAMFAVITKDYNLEQDYEATVNLLAECKKKIQQNEVDLEGYNSRENAADFEDLRKALGYKKWNLYGVSYGSRLGLTIMRDFPKSVRSAILLGVYPPESNLFGDRVRSIEKSLLTVFQKCEDNKDCNSRYPNLKERLQEVLLRMETDPFRFDYNGNPFVLNSHDAFALLFVSLYDRHTISNIPLFIDAIENNDSKPVIEFIRSLEAFYSIFNLPMNYSVDAYEELPFFDKSDLNAAIEQSEFGYAFSFYNLGVKLLSDWHSYRATAIENQPVVSKIPTLMVSGSLDQVTPPSNATSALKYLSNGHEVIFQNESHQFINPCLFKITKEFLNEPYQKPEIDCSFEKKPIEWNL